LAYWTISLSFSIHLATKRKNGEKRAKLTNTMLLQISQRIHTLPMTLRRIDIKLTIAINTTGAPQLDRIDDEPYNPEDEQYESPHYDDSGEQLPLRDEPEHGEDEEDREGGDGNPVGEIPGEEY
jgi:hypothetical protein